MFAKKYPDIDMVPWHDGETPFSKFVNVMFSDKFKHHVYFLGSLNWLGSVPGLGEYNFDYPVVYWKDIINNIEKDYVKAKITTDTDALTLKITFTKFTNRMLSKIFNT